MQKRLSYIGGANQQDRMVADKLQSLRKALLYSYQSATIVVRNTRDENGKPIEREFRALINPNKVTLDIDDKVISVPFEDIRLNAPKIGTTAQGLEPIGVKVGDVIEWKHKDKSTYWIIYDEYLQEIAYFRGQMRQCESDPLDINGVSYYYYLKGPDEKGINWQKSKRFIFNELNYTVEMYISKTTETTEFFHRFTKVNLPVKKPNGEIEFRPYEVQAVDDISSTGVLTVYLKEEYTNEWAPKEDIAPPEEPPIGDTETTGAQIIGPKEVYPYDIVNYSINNAVNGTWYLSNKHGIITNQDSTSATVEITTGRSGNISLIYKNDSEEIVYNISILSL